MATEYGVFNARGFVEGGFWRIEDAEAAADEHCAAGDEDAKAAPFCETHRDEQQPADCALCAAELAAAEADDDVEGPHCVDGCPLCAGPEHEADEQAEAGAR